LVLMVLRLIQGFGLGGEYGGAALMTIESAPESRRGFLGSLPQTAASVGIMLATGIFALCNHFLTSEQFLSWGWRIPFWLSAVMLIVGLFIRLHTEETLDFQKQKTTNNKEKSVPPLIELFKKHPRNILLALGARLAESVSSNIINAFGIVYISSQLALSRDIPLTGMLIASAIGIFSCPLVGWLSDRIGQKSLYLSGAGFCVLFAFPFFLLLDSKSTLIIWCSMILGYNLGPTMMFAVQPTLFTRMFGTKVRYTGLSFAYQFSAILGGLSPLIASSLLALGGGKPWYVALFLFAVSVLSFVCVWLIEPTDEQETASYRYIREQSHEN
ncbi:MFS transporter, partial [Escherichia coli]